MKNHFSNLNVILITLFIGALSVFAFSVEVIAVGGGGGGSVPTCSQDIWNCTAWGPCSTQGQQQRTCTLVSSCPGSNTPQPAQSQSCTPPAPTPAPVPTQPVAPAPAQPQPTMPAQSNTPKQPVCKQDVWQCNAWSASCDIYGNQSRNCKLISTCQGSNTPPPSIQQQCNHLQCGDKPDLHDRIACRLNLAPAGIARELAIQYLPEECRVLQDNSQKETCEERYKSYKPCWDLPAGETRFVCARSALNLGSNVAQEVQTCQNIANYAERLTCLQSLKDKVLSMIKFRFYDLEQRAEHLALKGADLSAVADFETSVELAKRQFNQTQDPSQLSQIILKVRKDWQQFLTTVKNQIK